MKRKWVLVRVACVVLGCLFVTAAWFIYDQRRRNAVETVIAELEARGIAKTIADFEADKPREEENAAPLLEEAFQLAESIPPLPDSDADWQLPDVPEAVRKRISLYDPVFELIYRAVERPRCRFDAGWIVQGSSGGPPLSNFREVAEALAVRPIVRGKQGDVDGALKDLRVLFGLTRTLREEPTLGLSVQHLRIAIAGYLLDVFRLILPRCPAPAEAFDRVFPDAARGAIAFGLQGELAAALWVAVNTESFFEGQEAEVSGLLIPGLKLDAAHLVRELGNYVEIARKPYPVAIELAEAAEARGDSGILGRDGGIITATMMTTLPIVEEARHGSRVALVKLGARCLEYRLEHGKYPESLDSLPEVGLDPLTERPFILEVLEDGIRLRSEKSEPEEERGAIEWELNDV